jgi:hypothetical protein
MTNLNYKGEPFEGSPESGRHALGLKFAVFNGQVNDADTRARALMSLICPKLLAEVEQVEQRDGGIMAIFKAPPTTATSVYAALVCGFVNEKVRFERLVPAGEPR